MRIFIHKIKHKLWENYKLYPPINYSNFRFLSDAEHSFNKIYSGKKKKIIEFEQILLMTGSSTDYKFMISNIKHLKKRLQHDDIKFLISPTNIAKDNAMHYLEKDKDIEKKIKVVLPSVNFKKIKKFKEIDINKKNKINLLFIGQKFYGKGGPICFEIAKQLNKKKINFSFKFVSRDIPSNYPIPENVEIIDYKISEDIKYRLLESSDLFIFPVVQDSFGVYLECIETQCVIITTDIYDKKEIITNNKTGVVIPLEFQLYNLDNFGYVWKNWPDFQSFFIQKFKKGYFEDIINQFVIKIEYFVNNMELINTYKKNIYEDSIGRFEFNNRKKRLIDIYSKIDN